MTFKDEITTLIENNVFWSDDDTCDISEDLPEKIIKVIQKKLDEEIQKIEPKRKTKCFLESIKIHTRNPNRNVCISCSIYTLNHLKEELEK